MTSFLEVCSFHLSYTLIGQRDEVICDSHYLMFLPIFVFIRLKMLVKNLDNHYDEYHLEKLKTDVPLKSNFLIRIKFSNLPTKRLECNCYVTNTNTLPNRRYLLSILVFFPSDHLKTLMSSFFICFQKFIVIYNILV